MLQTRVIPVLLLKGNGLYKGVKFKNHKYVGDPVNTVKIFNDKEVDEIIILDITATKEKKPINFKLLAEIANEAFMPFAYGGGINSIDDVKKLFTLGIEKVILNTYALENPALISEIVSIYGSQSVIFSLDLKKDLFRRESVYIRNGSRKIKLSPIECALQMQSMGIGEIMINDIDQDGMMSGYNIGMIEKLSQKLDIPLIVCGGCGSLDDLVKAKNAGGSAVAAGSFFIYHGPHKAVLLSYPKYQKLNEIMKEK